MILDQAYRLVRATVAVAQGETRQVCKVLPEDSVIVLEGANADGKTVTVRCGTEKLWMFARDWMERCRRLSPPEIESLPADPTLSEPPGSHDTNARWSSIVLAGKNDDARPIYMNERI